MVRLFIQTETSQAEATFHIIKNIFSFCCVKIFEEGVTREILSWYVLDQKVRSVRFVDRVLVYLKCCRSYSFCCGVPMVSQAVELKDYELLVA